MQVPGTGIAKDDLAPPHRTAHSQQIPIMCLDVVSDIPSQKYRYQSPE
jgi:hypothetical protein